MLPTSSTLFKCSVHDGDGNGKATRGRDFKWLNHWPLIQGPSHRIQQHARLAKSASFMDILQPIRYSFASLLLKKKNQSQLQLQRRTTWSLNVCILFMLPLALTATAILALATETSPHTFFGTRSGQRTSSRFRLSRSVNCHPLAERREVHSWGLTLWIQHDFLHIKARVKYKQPQCAFAIDFKIPFLCAWCIPPS